MAISGGSYKIDNDLQQSFKTNMDSQNSTVSSVIGGYSSSNSSVSVANGYGVRDASQNSHDMVGITPEMLSRITTAIDNYVSNLNSTLDNMPSAVDYTQAFKGEGITKAVENFVTSVKEICKSYLTRLKEAEQQIIESVHSQYSASDEDISGQLNSDASNISGNV